MATEALGVLAHISTLWAWLRRGDQTGEDTLVATNGSLQFVKKDKLMYSKSCVTKLNKN